MQFSQIDSVRGSQKIQSTKKIYCVFAGLVDGGDPVPRCAVESGTSVDSQQEMGPQSYNYQELNSANNLKASGSLLHRKIKLIQ